MDDLELLNESIGQVLSRDCEPRALHDFINGRGDNLAANLREQAGELGWLAIGVSEDAGGLDFGIKGAALLVRELGRRLAPGPFIPILASIEMIERFAPAEIREQVLPGLVSGERTAAIPASFDAKDNSGWLLGDIEDAILLLPGEAGLVLARASSGSEPVQDRGTWDRTRALWQRPADVEALCTLPGDAARHLEICANLLIAADTLGAMEGLFAITVDFLKHREQFGVPIGSFQALKHRMADLAAQIELDDCLLDQALDAAKFQDADAVFWSGMCKAEVTQAAAFLAGECLQLHGAIGFTWEHDCHLYLKRVRLNQALVRSNHALRQQGFDALEQASAKGLSMMEIGQ